MLNPHFFAYQAKEQFQDFLTEVEEKEMLEDKVCNVVFIVRVCFFFTFLYLFFICFRTRLTSLLNNKAAL